jgi:hypothetical protein
MERLCNRSDIDGVRLPDAEMRAGGMGALSAVYAQRWTMWGHARARVFYIGRNVTVPPFPSRRATIRSRAARIF